MFPRENFKILHAANAILVLCEHFSGKLFKFFDPNSEYFTEYDAYCSHILNFACLGHKAYCYRRGS